MYIYIWNHEGDPADLKDAYKSKDTGNHTKCDRIKTKSKTKAIIRTGPKNRCIQRRATPRPLTFASTPRPPTFASTVFESGHQQKYVYIYIYIYIIRQPFQRARRVRCLYPNHLYIYIYIDIFMYIRGKDLIKYNGIQTQSIWD